MEEREREHEHVYTKTLQCCEKTVRIHSDTFIFHPSLWPCCSLSWQWTCYWAQMQPTSFYLCREICLTTYWFLSVSPRNSVFHPVLVGWAWNAAFKRVTIFSIYCNQVILMNSVINWSLVLHRFLKWECSVSIQISTFVLMVNRKVNRCIKVKVARGGFGCGYFSPTLLKIKVPTLSNFYILKNMFQRRDFAILS